ncbi:MAG: hypothetical protein ACLTL6_15185 [Holdemanella porci]
MFLTEKELKDAFWKSYNNKGRAVKWQFECPVREGNTDLMTLEKYQENWQINAFEFKLTDIKKYFYRQKEIYLTAIKAGS